MRVRSHSSWRQKLSCWPFLPAVVAVPFTIFTSAGASPTALTRGPYLQNLTTSNIIVRWRTSQATNSVVRFGLANGAFDWGVTNSPETTEHAVTLTNLAPDTKYFYTIGAKGTNLAGGSNYFFISAPATQRPTRIWVIGDSGSASQPYFGLINDPIGMRNAYYTYTSNRYTDVWLMLGDNAYNVGADDEYQTNVFGVFPQMMRQTVLWSAIGNHDAVNSGAYLDIFDLPKNGEAGGVASGSELYYSFNFGNIHFVSLDSEISVDSALPTMLTWLDQDLAANTNEWLIAFWHTPPYTYGSHNSDYPGDSGGHLFIMRENVVPILESYGVDLVLCGHSHVYERSILLDGHYGIASTFVPAMAKNSGSGREDEGGAYLKAGHGPTAHQGAVYSVMGSSGWVTGAYDPNRYLNHPAMFKSLEQVGSLVLDVSSNRLDGKMLSHNGAIDDYFTILKGVGYEPPRIKTIRNQQGTVVLQFETRSGQRYQVDRATQLGPSDWQSVSPVITATGATTQWSGAAPANGNHFYRVTLVTN